jgi:hypothetical protein
MKMQAIIPVLNFINKNRVLMNLDVIAAKLRLHITVIQGILIDAELGPHIGYKLEDWQVATLLDMGVQLGVIHGGTEYEIVPVQAEITMHESYKPENAEIMETAKRVLAEKIGFYLVENNLIGFETIPSHFVQQRNVWDHDWKLNAKIKVLKEK